MFAVSGALNRMFAVSGAFDLSMRALSEALAAF
jgi:hypothetical protein